MYICSNILPKEMKRLLTLLLLLMFNCSLFASDFGGSGLQLIKDTVNLSGTASNSLSSINSLINTSSSSQDLKWEVVLNTVPTEWGLGFCDNEGCMDLSLAQSNIFTMGAGDTTRMDLTVNPLNKTGSGIIKIAVYPVGGSPSDGVMITHNINVTPDAINQRVAVTFSMYPNPVKDYLNINFPRKGTHHIEVYNILGNKVLVKDVSNVDYVRISFANFQRGRYIIMYRPESGKIITKSVTKE
jgi:hypothetical protein